MTVQKFDSRIAHTTAVYVIIYLILHNMIILLLFNPVTHVKDLQFTNPNKLPQTHKARVHTLMNNTYQLTIHMAYQPSGKQELTDTVRLAVSFEKEHWKHLLAVTDIYIQWALVAV